MTLSRGEAWLEVARQLESDYYSVYWGLCSVVRSVHREGKISRWRRWVMLRQIDRLSRQVRSVFVWPLTNEGRASRIAYCRRQAGRVTTLGPL